MKAEKRDRKRGITWRKSWGVVIRTRGRSAAVRGQYEQQKKQNMNTKRRKEREAEIPSHAMQVQDSDVSDTNEGSGETQNMPPNPQTSKRLCTRASTHV